MEGRSKRSVEQIDPIIHDGRKKWRESFSEGTETGFQPGVRDELPPLPPLSPSLLLDNDDDKARVEMDEAEHRRIAGCLTFNLLHIGLGFGHEVDPDNLDKLTFEASGSLSPEMRASLAPKPKRSGRNPKHAKKSGRNQNLETAIIPTPATPSIHPPKVVSVHLPAAHRTPSVAVERDLGVLRHCAPGVSAHAPAVSRNRAPNVVINLPCVITVNLPSGVAVNNLPHVAPYLPPGLVAELLKCSRNEHSSCCSYRPSEIGDPKTSCNPEEEVQYLVSIDSNSRSEYALKESVWPSGLILNPQEQDNSAISPQEQGEDKSDNEEEDESEDDEVQVVYVAKDPNAQPLPKNHTPASIMGLMKRFFCRHLPFEAREEYQLLLEVLEPYNRELFFFFAFRKIRKYFSVRQMGKYLDFPVPSSFKCLPPRCELALSNKEELSVRFYGRDVRNRMMQRNKKCTICLLDFKIDDVLRTLPCFHEYHIQCGDVWLNVTPSCPQCRRKIDVKTLRPTLITY